MSKITRELVESEVKETQETNAVMKGAAFMVGYDVDAQTDALLSTIDKRVRINLHQLARISTLQSLLEEEDAEEIEGLPEGIEQL